MNIVIIFMLLIGMAVAGIVFLAGKSFIEMKEKEHEHKLEQEDTLKEIERLKEKRVNEYLTTEEEEELNELIEESDQDIDNI